MLLACRWLAVQLTVYTEIAHHHTDLFKLVLLASRLLAFN